MSEIARDNGMTLKQLLALNPQIKDANIIKAGQELNLKSKNFLQKALKLNKDLGDAVENFIINTAKKLKNNSLGFIYKVKIKIEIKIKERIIENVAEDYKVPADILKAIGWYESYNPKTKRGWNQYDAEGNILMSRANKDGTVDYGAFQINSCNINDISEIDTFKENVRKAAKILLNFYRHKNSKGLWDNAIKMYNKGYEWKDPSEYYNKIKKVMKEKLWEKY